MSAPFLVRFVDQIVTHLEAHDEIELVPGRRADVVREVGGRLGTLGKGAQLITSLSKALIEHDGVEELFIDDEELKERVGELDPSWMLA